MKSARTAVAVVFVACCMMNGCKEDKFLTEPSIPDQIPPPIGLGVLMANINGSPWVAEDAAGVASGISTYSGDILHISGVRAVVGDTADAECIDLIIDLRASKAYLYPGTYELGTIPAQEGEAQYRDALSCVCNTNGTHSGTVTITKLDVPGKTVSGVFAFNGIGVSGQTHMVNEGMFNVTWK